MTISLLLLASITAGLVLGAAITRSLLKKKNGSVVQALMSAQLEIARLQERCGKSGELQVAHERELVRIGLEYADLRERCNELEEKNRTFIAESAQLKTSLEKEREFNVEKLQFLNEARDQLSATFKTVASDILDQKAGKLGEINEDRLGALLNPLQTKLREFNDSVHAIHYQQGQERAALTTELEQLRKLNQTLSADAQSLTLALKGSSKTQGNWGEMILKSILESSGLEEGRDYELRQTYRYEDGRRGQPDVVIKLPEGKHIVIDAKVSLSDYDAYVGAEDDIAAQLAADRHVDSVRRHMKELAEKNYHELYGLNSLDFVVMFIPVEPAFAAAIRMDPTLWDNALRKNVLVVSPSGLLFVLRTVGVLWRQESQVRNVREIAKKGADLYNKLVGFVEALDEIGIRLRQAQQSFEDARKKLYTGQGNVIRQAEMLKDLGIKPTKNLPANLTDAAAETPMPIPPLIALAHAEPIPGEIAAMAASAPIDEEEIPF